MEESIVLGLGLADAAMCAEDIIERVLDEGAEILYDKDVYERSHKFGIENTLNLIIAVVEIKYARYDPGPALIDEELEEPEPPCIDTWVRSAITIHKKFRTVDKEKAETFIPTETKTSMSFKSTFTRMNSMRKQKPPVVKIHEIAVPIPMNLPEPEVSDEEEYMRLKKERDYKRKMDDLARQEAVKKEEENNKRLLAKQLLGKSKNFTFDYQGGIIIVSQPAIDKDGEKIGYKITETILEEAKESPKPSPRGAHSSLPTERKPRMLEPIIDKQFKQIQSLSILDHIRLAPGVSIVSGNNTKSIPSLRGIDYLGSKKSPKNEMATKSSKASKDTDTEKEKSAQFIQKPIKNMNLLDSLSENTASMPNLPINIKRKLAPLVKESDQVKQYSLEMRNRDNLTAFDKFNLAIMTNSEWGKNPPTRAPKLPANLPKVATARDRWEIYGHIPKKPKSRPFMTTQELMEFASNIKKPRDRPFIEKVEHKVKPPPPPFGQTMNINFPLSNKLNSNE